MTALHARPPTLFPQKSNLPSLPLRSSARLARLTRHSKSHHLAQRALVAAAVETTFGKRDSVRRRTAVLRMRSATINLESMDAIRRVKMLPQAHSKSAAA